VGPPSTDPTASTNFGDLKSPHIKEYEGCPYDATSCITKPPEQEDKKKEKEEKEEL